MPRRRLPTLPLVVIAASVLVIVVAVVGYGLAATHQVLPGMRGCEIVRSVPAQSKCVERQFSGLMEGRSVEAGLIKIDALAKRNTLAQSQCHLAMHPIGERVGARAARAGRFPDPASGPSTCRQGYMHGMMLGFVSKSGNGDIAEALPALCERDGVGEGSCAHVVGHLIARKAGQAGAEEAIAAGCSQADVATDTGASTSSVTATDASECVRGGYMEIALTARQPPLATWRARCEDSPKENRAACFAWLVPLAQYRQLKLADAVKQCAVGGVDAAWHESCVAGIARNLSAADCSAFPRGGDRVTCTREITGVAPDAMSFEQT